MARRKKHTTKRRRSHRRGRLGSIANIGGGALVKVAGAVAGKYLSDFVSGMLPENNMKKWIAAATPIAGAIVTNMVSKAPLAKGLADGMLVIGGYQIIRETGVIKGVMDGYDRRFVALGPSFQNQRGVVAGTSSGYSPARSAAMLQ